MTNAELASALNDEFQLRGRDRVSENVIRQWVAWDLLPKATITGRQSNAGPVWNRDHIALKRARRFAELRYYGVRSQRALVAQAYLEWGIVPFERAKRAIIGEFHSAYRKLWRNLSATIPDGRVGDFSETKIRALRNQSGPLDPAFRGTQFEMSSPTLVAAMQSIFGGNADDTEQADLAFAALAQFAPSLKNEFANERIAPLVFPKALFAPPDETEFSGITALEAASELQFEQARKKLTFIAKAIHLLDRPRFAALIPKDVIAVQIILSRLGPQISGGHWLIAGFVQILMDPNCNLISINSLFPGQELGKVQ